MGIAAQQAMIPTQYTITITGANAGNSAGYLRSTAQGSIDPEYANIDQTTTTLGAMGQIDQFRATQDEGSGIWTARLTLAGIYANAAAAPFTSVSTPDAFGGTIVYAKADATFSTGGGATTFTWSNKQVSTGVFVLTVTV